jgi:hypothetical protein
MVSSKVKEKMMKSLEKSGLTRTGAIFIASLICWKSFFPSPLHSKGSSFFNKWLMGFTISTKFGTNVLMKLIYPEKDCKGFFSLERGIFLMGSIFEGSIEMASLDMICPNKFPLSTPKIDFIGLREMP